MSLSTVLTEDPHLNGHFILLLIPSFLSFIPCPCNSGPLDAEATKALLAQHARTVKLGERIMAPLVLFDGVPAPDEANLCTTDSPERGVLLEGFLAAPQGNQEIRVGADTEYPVSEVVKCKNDIYVALTDDVLRVAVAEADDALVAGTPAPAPSAAVAPGVAMWLAVVAVLAALV